MIATLARWSRRTAPAEPALRSAARSHCGHGRVVNEDRVLDRPDRGLWAIAGGMGGGQAGDVAADDAVAALSGVADQVAAITAPTVIAALDRANAAIFGKTPVASTAATTIIVAHVVGTQATIWWAGDSRAYRFRAGRRELLTSDHSVGQQLHDGVPDRRSQPTRALGLRATMSLERVRVELAPGDTLILCSAGIWPTLADDVRPIDAPDDLADNIVARALRDDGGASASVIAIAFR